MQLARGRAASRMQVVSPNQYHDSAAHSDAATESTHWVDCLFFALSCRWLFWVIRSYRRALKKRQEEAHKEPSSLEGEDMVRCIHCGVHLPRSESITSEGKFFCSEEHRRLHLES